MTTLKKENDGATNLEREEERESADEEDKDEGKCVVKN